MSRPTKPRWVEFSPSVTFFKPQGVPMSQLDEISLGVDEAEALRLKDLVGLEQEECAKRMNLAQSTFQRILTVARRKVSQALIEGKAIRIGGGNYTPPPPSFICRDCRGFWTNRDSQTFCPHCGGENVELERGPGRRNRRGHSMGRRN